MARDRGRGKGKGSEEGRGKEKLTAPQCTECLEPRQIALEGYLLKPVLSARHRETAKMGRNQTGQKQNATIPLHPPFFKKTVR